MNWNVRSRALLFSAGDKYTDRINLHTEQTTQAAHWVKDRGGAKAARPDGVVIMIKVTE
jgi:hypothetical protein